MELLKKLYCIHSKSNHEEKMLQFLIDWLFENIKDAEIEMDKVGNLYVRKGYSNTYPCIVSHVDQVQSQHSDDFQAVETDDIIFGWSNKNKRHEGLGADDKNGIWISLQCLMKYDVIKAAFFVGEEIGCVGSRAADMDFFDDCRFVLQCDRRGDCDFITEASLTELCSDEFAKATDFKLFGYSEKRGAMTDVMTLKENGLKVSCCNMSCGYYKPHTDDEFTIKSDLFQCLYFVENIIENVKSVYPHEYVYKPYTPYTPVNGYGYNGYYGGHTSNGYGGSYKSSQNVSNCSTPSKSEQPVTHRNNSSEVIEDENPYEEINKFFGEEDDANTDWLNDIEEPQATLDEEMRDELYDIIYVLLNDCPSASCDMIYSALKSTYPTLSWEDARAMYNEVKFDMKKYLSLPCC